MSDYTITPEAIGYRPSLVTTPFYPSIQTTVEGEGESATTVYKVKFNQGYVYEHSVGLISPIPISYMDITYTIETGSRNLFYVELYVDGDNNVSNAYFIQAEGVDGQDAEMPEDTASVKYFEVCRMEDLGFTSFKLRENIHWSGGAGSGAFTHPFRLIRVDATTWRIETEGSSIINDDDGSSITITNLGNNRTSNGYVYIQCAISSGPVPAGTATVEVSVTAKDEIEVAGGVQTYANLLIGQVYVNLAGDDLDISQAWNNAAILSMMFESGALRWAFQAHPSHVSSLTAGT